MDNLEELMTLPVSPTGTYILRLYIYIYIEENYIPRRGDKFKKDVAEVTRARLLRLKQSKLRQSSKKRAKYAKCNLRQARERNRFSSPNIGEYYPSSSAQCLEEPRTSHFQSNLLEDFYQEYKKHSSGRNKYSREEGDMNKWKPIHEEKDFYSHNRQYIRELSQMNRKLNAGRDPSVPREKVLNPYLVLNPPPTYTHRHVESHLSAMSAVSGLSLGSASLGSARNSFTNNTNNTLIPHNANYPDFLSPRYSLYTRGDKQ